MPAGATYEPLATTTLTSSQATISFTSISGSYTDLKIIITYTQASNGYLYLQYNSDTGTNYSATGLRGNGTTVASTRYSSTATAYLNTLGQTQTHPQVAIIDIFSYAGSTNKTALASVAQDQNGSGLVSRTVMLWRSTSVITRIDIKGDDNFNSGTTATLYGIKAA